jgi:hypothetical protein
VETRAKESCADPKETSGNWFASVPKRPNDVTGHAHGKTVHTKANTAAA